jgi:hypothetical protein
MPVACRMHLLAHGLRGGVDAVALAWPSFFARDLKGPLAIEGSVHYIPRVETRPEHGVPKAVQRSHTRIWIASVLAVLGGTTVLLLAAKAAQREARIMERLRPVCDHSGFTHVELTRLVRSETRPFSNKDDAVRNLMAICREGHSAGGRT